MPDLTAKKSDYLSRVVDLSERLTDVLKDAQELTSYRGDNGFETGGTNAIADADCVGENAHLTAATVDAVVQVGAALTGVMTLPRWASLRKANRGPQF
jgi:hypothetical protein